MQKFEWRSFSSLDFEKLRATRIQFHRAVQTISEVGRHFSPHSDIDESAALIWVPGFSRLAGKWVKGRKSFRCSLSMPSFSIFLVDHKVSTIAEYALEGKNSLQVMVWLEEQLAKLGLKASHLVMHPPYELPSDVEDSGEIFQLADPAYAAELAKYFHNSFVSIRDFKHRLRQKEDPIYIWPHRFDQALEITVKDSGDPETNSRIALGMSPGDEHIDTPYFYVSCWPFADIRHLEPLDDGGSWVAEDWTGAVLHAKDMLGTGQKEKLDGFYRQASDQLIKYLTN